MAGASVEASVNSVSKIFSRRLPFCEVISSPEITDKLELTRFGVPVEGISHPLLDSIKRSSWFSIEGGRIYIELRNFALFGSKLAEKIKIIRGVDFDDCIASATRWHRREQELMEEKFGVPAETGKHIYEMSKIMVPGKVEGEKRYTPRLNMALLTAYTDLIRKGVSQEKVFEEISTWGQTIAGLVQSHGEMVIARQAVDPQISDLFAGNHISRFLYRDFVNAVFSPEDPGVLRFIATRGKIEAPLGQVHKVHTSGVLGRSVDMVVYTNDIKAETLLHLSKLLSPQTKKKTFYLFDDNVAEIVPYLETAESHGLDNIWVVQVSHPDAKRKDARIDLTPEMVLGRENSGETVFRYYTKKTGLHLSGKVLFAI